MTRLIVDTEPNIQPARNSTVKAALYLGNGGPLSFALCEMEPMGHRKEVSILHRALGVFSSVISNAGTLSLTSPPGIFGEKDNGAYSIVLSGGNGYHDQDDGDAIEYSGTEGKDGKPTENTLHLITSARIGNPIRVIRSAQLRKTNKYRPELGLRYDGLYTVKSYMLVNDNKAMYRFKLQRCGDQEPIRCEDNAARRPTLYEVQEYKKLKEKVW